MKTLVISDIHHRIGWIEPCLKELGPFDEIVYLGDYFDDFDDTIADVKATAEWLKRSLKQPNTIHLLGNHDAAYRFRENVHVSCSGHHPLKSREISQILKPKDWDKTKLYHYTQGFLLSHAGVHPMVFGDHQGEISIPRLAEICEMAIEEGKLGLYSQALGAGRSRGGRQKYGGITWLDWNNEFFPVEGLPQIVGHTPHKKPVILDGNYCLDTHSKHLIIIEDGAVTIIENKWLSPIKQK